MRSILTAPSNGDILRLGAFGERTLRTMDILLEIYRKGLHNLDPLFLDFQEDIYLLGLFALG